jgi:hypothetical protein
VRDFLVSSTSFIIIALVMWVSLLIIGSAISFLAYLGLPTSVSWFVTGFAVALCKPSSAVLRLCSEVYEKVHTFFWRF